MHDTYLDQAAGLRRMATPRSTKVIAITGGKGGVGKTLTAVNLGAAFAGLGRSTMLLDADLGLANVDVLLGLNARVNLEHVIKGECGLEDIILTAPSGLRVVPASSGNLNMATLSRVQHAGLINAFSQLFEPLDVLLIDTAAGLGDGVCGLVVRCHCPTTARGASCRTSRSMKNSTPPRACAADAHPSAANARRWKARADGLLGKPSTTVTCRRIACRR